MRRFLNSRVAIVAGAVVLGLVAVRITRAWARRVGRFSLNRGRPAIDHTGNRTNPVADRRGELPNLTTAR
jgi:hypothetical protein